MYKPLLYIVALIVLFGVAYMVWSRAPRLPDYSAQPSTVETTQMRTERIREDTTEYSIDAQYPQFGIEGIDALIEREVQTAVAAFKAYPTDTPSVDSVPKNEQSISFDDVYIGPDYTSVSLTISEYTGGAHPNAVILGVNVDRASGKEVALEDALSLIGKNLAQVAREADAQLKASLGEAYFADGATAESENYATFLISKDSVTFIFNSYQVGPYAAGPQYVTFARVR